MSIITDQVQGIAVSILFFFCVIYVAADFRHPLPNPFPGQCCDCGADGCCTGERDVPSLSIRVRSCLPARSAGQQPNPPAPDLPTPHPTACVQRTLTASA